MSLSAMLVIFLFLLLCKLLYLELKLLLKCIIIIILFATRITNNNIKYVDNNMAGCQKRIKTLIKLATYYIKHNG